MEDWRIVGLEDWWIGGLEDWRIGGLVDWWIGGLEDWRIGGLVDWRIGGLALFYHARHAGMSADKTRRFQELKIQRFKDSKISRSEEEAHSSTHDMQGCRRIIFIGYPVGLRPSPATVPCVLLDACGLLLVACCLLLPCLRSCFGP